MSEQTKASARIAGPRDAGEGGTPPVNDSAFARWLADRAGQILLQVRAETGHASHRWDDGRGCGVFCSALMSD